MFNLLANAFAAPPPGGTGNPTDALNVHPGQLSRWLDEMWRLGPLALPAPLPFTPFLGLPGGIVPALGNPAGYTDASGINPSNPSNFTGLSGPIFAGPQPIWNHLIYAYL